MTIEEVLNKAIQEVVRTMQPVHLSVPDARELLMMIYELRDRRNTDNRTISSKGFW